MAVIYIETNFLVGIQSIYRAASHAEGVITRNTDDSVHGGNFQLPVIVVFTVMEPHSSSGLWRKFIDFARPVSEGYECATGLSGQGQEAASV